MGAENALETAGPAPIVILGAKSVETNNLLSCNAEDINSILPGA